MEEIMVKQLGENIYRFHEESTAAIVDAYLVIGTKCAVMIDGLDQAVGMYALTKKITDKPISMIITHGHWDHVGKGMQEFMEAGCPIYISPRDFYMVENKYGEQLKKEVFHDLEDGMEFDLGDTSLRILAMPGHTKGSMLVYMEKEKVLFSSDAIGSGGLWMQLKESSSLVDYLPRVQKLEKFLNENGPIKIYPGHTEQIRSYTEEDQEYQDIRYIKELIKMTIDIIEKRLVGDIVEIPLDIMKGIEVRSAKGKFVWDYCYDGQHIEDKG